MSRVVAEVRGPTSRKYLLDTDLEWVVKLMTHEPDGRGPEYADERDAVAWTVFQRWMGPAGDSAETFRAMIQKFAQPVNPGQIGRVLWYDRRDTALQGDPPACIGVEGSDACAQARAERRWARIAGNLDRPLSEYPPEIVAQAQAWMAGKRPNRFPGWTDFAAPFVGGSGGEERVYGPRGMLLSNVFYREPWARSWTTSTVSIYPIGSRRLLRAGLGLVGGILVGGLVLGTIWKRHQARQLSGKLSRSTIRR